ncbi:hypothetical protein GQ54DRAFT_316231 [Martensiomyces pterosporus]|nr:hypothetical protein GQ54DRAFT_316231 [Martensiomyces pterosporus]
MQCDTPIYDDFVKEFLATKAAPDCQPSIKIARKFCSTWPVPGSLIEAGKSAASKQDTVQVAVMDSSFNPPHYCHGAYLECLGTQQLTPVLPADEKEPPQLLGMDAFLLLLGSTNADKRLTGSSLGQRMRMVDMLATTVACDTTADTWHVWKEKKAFDASNLDNMAIGMVNCSRFVDKCQAVAETVQAEWARTCGSNKGGDVVDDKLSVARPRVLSYFAMGWDTLIRFFDPKYYKNFPADVDLFFERGGRIAFSRRIGFADADVGAFFAQPVMETYKQFIFELTLPKRVKHISSTQVRLAVRDSTECVRDIPPRILEYVNNYQLYRK